MIVCLLFLSNCKDEQVVKSFKIDNTVNEVIKNNEKCLEIFEKVFYVDSNQVKNNLYVESLTNRFIEYNKDQTYERLIFLKISEEGEVYDSTSFGIQIKNEKALITKYSYDNKQPKFVSKEISNFDANNFFNPFTEEELKRDRNYNLLIIDFKSNESCDCMFSGSLSRIDIEKIKNLTFFD
ncbi:hypothetical protein [uncultured Aquimarina sp.]|uniref:hypothetical protein n=1 Tax=uncultured Aquimarina sp. TaxID=575652 RepID=UPI0026186DFE|nr:hypothetical protein [uncultured Aquimarina sp.]